MYYLYILYSESRNQYYVGQTKSVEARLSKHNGGYTTSTKSGIPWSLKKVVIFGSKKEAIKAERWLKRMKSRRVIEKVISGEINMHDIVTG